MHVSDRSRTIEHLRELLRQRIEPGLSLCAIMTREQLFCCGFKAWSDAELRERFDWFCLSRPGIEREELEALADRWQLALISAGELELPCDICASGPSARRACMGWPRFTDDELLAFLAELEPHGRS